MNRKKRKPSLQDVARENLKRKKAKREQNQKARSERQAALKLSRSPLNRKVPDGMICATCHSVTWHDGECPHKGNERTIHYNEFCQQKAAEAALPINKFNYERLQSMTCPALRKMLNGLARFHDMNRKEVHKARKAELIDAIRAALVEQDRTKGKRDAC